jgi:hypothetical protein
MIAYLSSLEETYSKSFELNETPTVTLSHYVNGKINEHTISRPINDIDIWTFPRVMSAMKDFFNQS